MVAGFQPESLVEALEYKNTYKEALLYTGGTDFCVRHLKGERILYLNRVKEMKEITEDEEYIYLGASVTYSELLNESLVPEVLKKAMRGIAAPAIRNIGTLGGNIGNASPAGDTLPVLYALNAIIEVASFDGIRQLPIEDVIVGIRKLSLTDKEIITKICIKKQNFSHVYYQKVGARKSQVLAKASFVGLANVEDGIVTKFQIAFGSVATTSVRKREIEESILGKSATEIVTNVDEIIAKYQRFITPIDDQRSTAIYRKQVCINMLRDFIEQLVNETQLT